MAKGQQKSNKEIKKPKKTKAVPATPAPFSKGVSSLDGAGEKKG